MPSPLSVIGDLLAQAVAPAGLRLAELAEAQVIGGELVVRVHPRLTTVEVTVTRAPTIEVPADA